MMKNDIKRSFQPLDEWLYLKIFINPICSDLVISRYLLPLVDELYPELSIKWFFLRYRDPEYHIRIRFLIGDSPKILKSIKIIKKHLAKATDDGYVIKWIIDGYDRELERYGITNIVFTEQYFCISSDLIARSLQYLSDSLYTVNCMGIWLMHVILRKFIPMIDNRLELCRLNMQFYCSEYSIDNMRGMNDSCRKYRKFTDILETESELSVFPDRVAFNMVHFRNSIESLIEEIDESKIQTLNISSIIHMDMNRLYNNNARKIEMVLYYILYKKYTSDKIRYQNI